MKKADAFVTGTQSLSTPTFVVAGKYRLSAESAGIGATGGGSDVQAGVDLGKRPRLHRRLQRLDKEIKRIGHGTADDQTFGIKEIGEVGAGNAKIVSHLPKHLQGR